jgi:hypothetical protein
MKNGVTSCWIGLINNGLNIEDGANICVPAGRNEN